MQHIRIDTLTFFSAEKFQLIGINAMQEILKFKQINCDEKNLLDALMQLSIKACIDNGLDITADNLHLIFNGSPNFIQMESLHHNGIHASLKKYNIPITEQNKMIRLFGKTPSGQKRTSFTYQGESSSI